jgi:predicted Zn-dependent peptidase
LAHALAQTRCAPSPRPGSLQLADARVNRCYIEAIGPAPAAGHPARYAAGLAADLAGDDEGSRLYWALVEPGLAEDASLSYLPQDGVGCYMLSASCDPDRADEVERLARATLLAFARGDGLEARELERGRNKLATQWVLRSESPAGRMRSIGSQWLYRREFLPLAEHLRRLDAVDQAAMLELLREHPTVPICSVRLLPA